MYYRIVKKIECIIKGQVHGVGFRDFICQSARGFGLVGEVRNLPDGTVRIIAQGEEKNLLNLIQSIHKGPMFAKVESVETTWSEAKDQYDDFKIVLRD